jgi:transposase
MRSSSAWLQWSPTTKSILETRPIYHKCDETIRDHVFCSFLALLLKAELERRRKFF